MTLDLIDRDEDIVIDPEEKYQSVVRAFKRAKGFGLFFIICSQARGEQLINKFKQDIPNQKIEVLRLVEPINKLYERIEELTKQKEIDILFIQGIEYSLYQYELKNFGKITENQYNNFTSVPRILNHLNQQRERFRDNFKLRLVFILRPFARNYFIYRAPDFFDWSSGKWEFPMEPEVVEEKSRLILLQGDYEKYLTLTPQERVEKILEFQELLAEKHQNQTDKADLLFELGNLLVAGKEYEGAIASYDEALEIKPDSHEAWNNQGSALGKLEKYEEAIASYDRALEIKPDSHEAWNNRGSALDDLENYEKAIACYDRALEIKPDDHQAWYNRGIALFHLGEYREAIASYNWALKIKPDNHQAWNNRGGALFHLGEYREAIASYDEALKFQPDNHQTWDNRGLALMKLEKYEESLSSLDKAIEINPEYPNSWYNKACCYALQGNVEQAIENLQQAITLNPQQYREMAKTDPDFDKIREEKRFIAVLK